jgi:Spy/CpxP family protein refolding chaperone
MFSKTTKILAIVFVAILALAVVAYTRAKHRPLQPRGPVSIEARLFPTRAKLRILSRRLKLTDDQIAQVRTLGQSFRTDVQPGIQAAIAARQAFKADAVNTDEARLRADVDSITQANKQILNSEVTFWLGFKKMLTPDQQQKLLKQLGDTQEAGE